MASVRSGSLQREKTPPTLQEPHEFEEFKTLRYEETVAAKAPIPVTVAPPRVPPTETHPALRSRPPTSINEDIYKRDSGLAPTESTGPREGSFMGVEEQSSIIATANGAASPHTPNTLQTPSLKKSDSSTTTTGSRWKKNSGKTESTPKTPDDEFSPLTTPIPSSTQLGLDFMNDISFSKRGSVLLGGKRVAAKGQTRAQSKT